MSKYRRVEVQLWRNGKFRKLSAPAPNAQTLWFYLLTGFRTIQIPGVVIGSEVVLADDLGWSIESFRDCFSEVAKAGLATADWSVGLVVLTTALIDRTGTPRESSKPANPNILKSWVSAWDDIPDCALKDSLLRTLGDYSRALGKAYAKAFTEAFAKALAKPLANLPPQEQEKEQEQEQEQDSGEKRARQAPIRPAISGADPDPRRTQRQAILQDVHREHREIYERVRLQVSPGARPMAVVGDPAERALAKHLAELVTLETAEADCRHVLAIREAEGIRKRTVQYLGASVWSPIAFARALTMTATDAEPEEGVGRYEPRPASAYGTGEQIL